MVDFLDGAQEPEMAADVRRARRRAVLEELAQARELRKRLRPRTVRLARERAAVHAATLRR